MLKLAIFITTLSLMLGACTTVDYRDHYPHHHIWHCDRYHRCF